MYGRCRKVISFSILCLKPRNPEIFALFNYVDHGIPSTSGSDGSFQNQQEKLCLPNVMFCHSDAFIRPLYVILICHRQSTSTSKVKT